MMGENTVWLISFWHARHRKLPAFSIAVSQPDGFEYPELEFLKPIGPDGRWLSSQSKTFKKDYEAVLNRNHKEVAEWLDRLEGGIALTCWCRSKPYKLSRCHRILVGNLVRRMRGDLDVRVDLRSPAWKG